MRKYHPDEDATVGPPPTAVNQPSQFLQLMNEYEDEQAEEEDDALDLEETIDEEYSSYINSVPKHAAVLDPLKFWEVSIDNCHSSYITDIYKKNSRPIAKLSQHYTKWPSIIY